VEGAKGAVASVVSHVAIERHAGMRMVMRIVGRSRSGAWSLSDTTVRATTRENT